MRERGGEHETNLPEIEKKQQQKKRNERMRKKNRMAVVPFDLHMAANEERIVNNLKKKQKNRCLVSTQS